MLANVSICSSRLVPLCDDLMRIWAWRVYTGSILAMLYSEYPTSRAVDMTNRYHFDSIAYNSSLMLMLFACSFLFGLLFVAFIFAFSVDDVVDDGFSI